MPEGDTLWNIAARLRPALVGMAAQHVVVHRPSHPPPVAGSRVQLVEAAGKHLIIGFEDGTAIHTHLQMSGEWHLYRRGARWRDSPGAVRVHIATETHDAVCFRAPTVDVFPPHDPRPRPWHLIGPDLCVDPVDLEAMVRNSHRLDQATQIADVLLDQRVASGIGNVYKSEVLWACRTDPFSPVERLPDPRRLELYATAARQLRANLGRGKRVTFQRGLAVYGRGGRDCPRCHATIRSDAQGPLARVTYWCPRCQPAA